MLRRILISISFCLPILSITQEDSTVYLKPVFPKGTILNYTLSSSNYSEVNGQSKVSKETYQIQLEFLKSAYGLQVVRMNYKAVGVGNEQESLLKDELPIYITIDSNTRFVAIENSGQIIHALKQRTNEDLSNLNGIESFFPEIELLFMLNGARYKKGEIYSYESKLPIGNEIINCRYEFELTKFSRQENLFIIRCLAKLLDENEKIHGFTYQFLFTYRLSDLIPLSILSNQGFEEGESKFHLMSEIEKN